MQIPKNERMPDYKPDIKKIIREVDPHVWISEKALELLQNMIHYLIHYLVKLDNFDELPNKITTVANNLAHIWNRHNININSKNKNLKIGSIIPIQKISQHCNMFVKQKKKNHILINAYIEHIITTILEQVIWKMKSVNKKLKKKIKSNKMIKISHINKVISSDEELTLLLRGCK